MLTTVKGVLLILFLYLALVWVGAFYWAPGNFINIGLLGTIVGLAVLLLTMVGSWAFGILKASRAKAAARPRAAAPVARPESTASPEAVELKNLLLEAGARLKASTRFKASDEQQPLAGMPLYLVVGIEGSGKTSVVLNSGLEAELLAGQGHLDRSSVNTTHLANVWLAGDAILLELGGRHFGGDGARWQELLKVLAAGPAVSLWRRLLKGRPQGMHLRGVIHCCDLRFFLSKPGPEQIERQSQLSQERLRAVQKIVGYGFPVYTVFTRADQVPYFKDFAARLSVSECIQVLGTTLPLNGALAGASDPSQFAATETKRLAKAYQAITGSLAARRLSLLLHESVFVRKGKIYEFPREFSRMRQDIVNFLVQVFRPSPLEPTPVNRGFYFSGTREVEAALPQDIPTHTEITRAPMQAMDATAVFRGDPLELSRTSMGETAVGVARARRGGLQTQWVFLDDLFDKVISRDPAFGLLSAVSRPAEARRVPVVPIVGIGVAAVLALCLLGSWIQNRSLVARVQAAAEILDAGAPLVDRQGVPTLKALTGLEELRKVVEELSVYSRAGAPLSMRFGLYAGSDLTAKAREKYFRALRGALLDGMHTRLKISLGSLTTHLDTPELAAQGPQIVEDQLKTYVMMSDPKMCAVDSVLVGRTLTAMLPEVPIADADRTRLASAQIDFFASELKFGKAVDLPMDQSVVDRGVAYLRNANSSNRYYRILLRELESKAGRSASFIDVAPDYKKVLTVPPDVSAAFSPAGWEHLEARLKSGEGAPTADPCVVALLGEGASLTSLDEDGKGLIRELYARDFLGAWKDYLSRVHVLAYTSPKDAADKLTQLAEFRSPLLGVFKFVGSNTYFPRLAGGGEQGSISKEIARRLSGLGGGSKETEAPSMEKSFTLGDVSGAFDKVHNIVPPQPQPKEGGSEKAVMAYMEALAKLGAAMQGIARKSDADSNQAAQQALDQALESVRQLTIAFNPQSVGGVDGIVASLLKEPIRNAAPFIRVVDKVTEGTGDLDRAFRGLCGKISPILSKYPFSAGASTDLTLKEFSEWFAPGSGGLWKIRESTLAEFTAREGNRWTQLAGSPIKAPQQLLDFLNNAQKVTDAFFPGGAARPHLDYTLSPVLSNSKQVLNLSIDGRSVQFKSGNTIREDFNWPARSDSSQQASGRTGTSDNSATFSSQRGPWAIFRMVADAELRSLGENSIEWKRSRGASGALEPIEPPVRLTVRFPGGVDVFQPNFFTAVSCTTPTRQAR